MRTMIIKAGVSAVMFTVALIAVVQAHAQTYPTKPIKIVVPYRPGGASDLVARLVGEKLNKAFGTPVIVDNRPGANGILGTELVARAAPDGYTLSTASVGTHAANASLYASLPYDTVKDFAPVTLAVNAPMVLIVHPSLPVRSVRELIVFVKTKPQQIAYASGGNGSSQHLAMELLKLITHIDMIHVPYKGGAEAYTDLIAGNVSLMIGAMPPALPHIQSGRLRALATAGAKRVPQLPELPTIAEAGVRGYEADAWHGFVTRAGTPRPVVEKLNVEIVKALHAADVKERLAAAGLVMVGNSPDEFLAFIKSEIEKAARIVKAANIKPN